MIEKLYRVWNKTRQAYQGPNTNSNKFYANETGAKLGIRRFREWLRHKEDEFEIHEYVAIPKALFDRISRSEINELHYIVHDDYKSEYATTIALLLEIYDEVMQ